MARFRSRSLARRRAFQALYGAGFSPVRTVDDLRAVFDRIPSEDGDDAGQPDVLDYAWELCSGAWANAPDLDAAIARHSRNWRPDRIGKVELTLLRLAFYEIRHERDVPVKVVINEALDLATRFTTSQAKHFINGILDSAKAEAGRE